MKSEACRCRRLIDVKIQKRGNADFGVLAENLAQVSPLASIDNHKLWLNKLIRFADGLENAGAEHFVFGHSGHVRRNLLQHADQSGTAPLYYRNPSYHGGKRRVYCPAICPQNRMAVAFGRVIGVALSVPTIFLIASLAEQIEGGIISGAAFIRRIVGNYLDIAVVCRYDCDVYRLLYRKTYIRKNDMRKLFIIAALCLLLLWFAGFLWFNHQINSYENTTGIKTDAIVALTGGRNRISNAVALLNDGAAEKLFISGVSKQTSLTPD